MKTIKAIIITAIVMMITLKLMSMALDALINEQDNSPRPTRAELQDYCENGMQSACDALTQTEQ